MKRPLFDVVLAVSGTDTGGGLYDVQIIDRYHKASVIIGEKSDIPTLNEAIEFARGAVSAFMKGTTA